MLAPLRFACRPARPIALAGIGGALAIASTSSGQWSAVSLAPPGSDYSVAYGAEGRQVGVARFGDHYWASVWTGTASSWNSLNPSGALHSAITGADAAQQAGQVQAAGLVHASLWSGSPETWVDLHPPAAAYSVATAVHSGRQAGFAHLGGEWHPSVWAGSPATWVDLLPASATQGYAWGVYAGRQVGTVRVDGWQHASLWAGSAGSWVDLNPDGAPQSEGRGIYGSQQVGNADVDGVTRASLWEGTAESWVDLHPPAATLSVAYAAHDGQQVGFARVDGVERACVWSGSPGSWRDLHAVLPASYTSSEALGIWHDAGSTYIVGSAVNTDPNRTEAMMWVFTPPPCSEVLSPPTRTVCLHHPATLSVGASGVGPFTYQWRFNGEPIDGAANPTALTPNLRLPYVTRADEGLYDCTASNGCGSITGGPTALTVCGADTTCDGFLDFFDYDAFVVGYETGDPVTDFNDDGFSDFFDYDGFVEAFELGC